jgi:hypothetical protein
MSWWLCLLQNRARKFLIYITLIPKGPRQQRRLFWSFWIGCCECNKFVDFLKLFQNVDMDGSLGFMVDELEGFKDFGLALSMVFATVNAT